MGVYILSSKIKTYSENDARAAYVELFGKKPETVIGQESYATYIYREKLLRRVKGIFEIDGMPDTWDSEYFWRNLLLCGYISVTNTPEFGVIPMICSFHGLNIFNKPTMITIDNHIIQGLERKLGIDAELVVLQYNSAGYPCGISPLLNMYAEKLACIDGSIASNLINTRTAYIFDCADKAQSETAKKFYDELSQGKPAIFSRSQSINGDGGVKYTVVDVNKIFCGDKLQEQKRQIWAEFDTEIGINNSSIQKSERVNTLEVTSNNGEIMNSVEEWRRNLEKSFMRVNKTLGLNLRLRMPYYEKMQEVAYQKGGDSNVDNKPERPIEN